MGTEELRDQLRVVPDTLGDVAEVVRPVDRQHRTETVAPVAGDAALVGAEANA